MNGAGSIRFLPRYQWLPRLVKRQSDRRNPRDSAAAARRCGEPRGLGPVPAWRMAAL